MRVEFYSINQLIEECILFNYPIYTSKNNFLNSILLSVVFYMVVLLIRNILKNLEQLITIKNELKIFLKNFSKQTQYIFNKLESINFEIPRYIANIIRIKILLKSILKKPLLTLNLLIKSYFNV